MESNCTAHQQYHSPTPLTHSHAIMLQKDSQQLDQSDKPTSNTSAWAACIERKHTVSLSKYPHIYVYFITHQILKGKTLHKGGSHTFKYTQNKY